MKFGGGGSLLERCGAIVSPHALMFYAGALSFGAGGLFYLFFRNPTIFQEAIGIGCFSTAPNATVAPGCLPSFIHVFSFSLLTIAAGKLRGRQIFQVCSFWVAANIGCECLQVDSIAYGIPNEGIVVGTISQFARNGTFDWLDVTASIIGGVASGLAAESITTNRKTKHENI